MKSRFAKTLLLLASLCFASANVLAEDIDIYQGISTDGSNPNLLIILDNSAAWDASLAFTCTDTTVSPATPVTLPATRL